MKNWEVLQKKISEMNKDEFITFAKEKLSCHTLMDMSDMNNVECGKCKHHYFGETCKHHYFGETCKEELLKDEYQEPKQEKWIVHRTLRTQNKEIYIKENHIFQGYVIEISVGVVGSTYDKEKATKFTLNDAIKVRDELNKDRVGKQYLWVISKVEE